MGFTFNTPEIINIKDTETGLKMLDKLSRIKDGRRIEPLDSMDNVLYPHRYLYDAYNLQIGDTYFMIPPEFIMVSSESTSQSIVTLRQENTQKMKAGYHKRTILIDLVFNGMEQLNGYRVEGPEGYYYVDGLRQLLAQFKCTPFLPISNELINGMYGIFTVALQSITLSTIQGFPNAMTAQITLQEVNMFPYIEMPDVCFKYMIDWDLFRFYYQSFLTENHDYKKLQSLPANKKHNRFKISILDSSVFTSKEATKANMLEIICDQKQVRYDENGNLTTNYVTWLDSNESDVVITGFQCGYSNILTNIQLSDSSSPTVQFMGGMDTIYNIVFETTDYAVVQALEQCQVTNDLLTRNNIKLRSVGFVKLESELVEFTGSLFVMIESVVTNTVPGFPGLYNVQMQCVAYDIAQSEREDLHGFRPFDCSHSDCLNNDFDPDDIHMEQAIEQSMNGLLTKIKQDNYAEWKIRTSMEVYPDLHLPTYKEVNDFIDKCKTFRSKNGLTALPYDLYPTNPVGIIHGAHPNNEIAVNTSNGIAYMQDINTDSMEYNIFVDPDFYVFYPCSYMSFQENSEEDYYDYIPKQRSAFSKTKISEVYPNYSGEGSSSNLIEQLISLAYTFIGCEYEWGASGETDRRTGRLKFDCSGYITYLFKKLGIMPSGQGRFTVSTMVDSDLFEKVDFSQRKRGDILCKSDKTHTAIYLGTDQIIHASNSSPYPEGGVKISNLYFKDGICLRPKAFISTTSSTSGSYGSTEQIKRQDLGKWKTITVDEMNKWIASKAPADSPFIGQGIVFIQAGQVSGLDPRYLLAHAALETGWGKSNIAKVKNNYYGIAAFDASPFKSAYSFDGFKAGIIEGAKWIAKNYYNGKYNQKTLHSMRWNNNVHQYASDPNWDTKIASLMASAPVGSGSVVNNSYTLTTAEFESICRVVMAETKGEPTMTEKAVAQVIYDRLTHKDKKFNGLSDILNSSGQFEAPYLGALNSTVEDNVRAVFCDNEKIWPDYQVWFFLTPDDTNATYKNRDAEYTRIGEIGKHTFWGDTSKGSSVKYTIVDSTTTGDASSNSNVTENTISYDTVTLSDVGRFAEPVLAETDAIVYDESWGFWKNITAKDNAKNHLNDGLNIFNTTFCDEYQYSGRGRLVRAFPTYLFCILDDNAQWYDGRKLWTNYYVHRSVVDIAVHGTNDMPTETATLVITNSYHNLDRTQGGLSNYSIENDDGYNSFVRWFYKNTGMLLGFGPKLTDKLIKLHQVIYDHAKLREGARIHLRMGYGSDPLSLAPVMNGHISDVSLGDQITIVVTSDGHELVQHITSASEKDTQDGFLGLFGLFEEQESSNIISTIMCARQSWFTYLNKETFEGSKYSIEHFGLYFNQDVMEAVVGITAGAVIGTTVGSVVPGIGTLLGLGVGAALGAIGGFLWSDTVNIADLWNGNQEQYDILKNVYKADYSREHYIYTDFALDWEKNFVFNKYNMTPWDVFQVCTQQVPEYIVKPSYHQFDSRIYFGLPFWMEKYRYDYLNGKVYEECKASTQAHILDSMSNIIDNQVKVTSKFSNTNIKVMYTIGNDVASTKVLHSDDTIDFAYQKTSILDTPISQDALGPDKVWEFLGYNIGEEAATRVGISNLLYGWQQQYQGQIILMGMPGIKPHDYIMISDTFSQLYGVALIREVVHSFNVNTGFTTSVTPGMIGFNTKEESGMIVTCQNLLMILNCFSSYIETRRQLRNNYEQYLTIFSDFEIVRNKFNSTVLGHMVVDGLISLENKVFLAYYGRTAFTLAKNIKNLPKSLKVVDTFKEALKGVKGIKQIYNGIKTGTTAIAGAVTGGTGAVVSFAIWTLVDILISDFLEWIDNKNVCVLLPLWWENYPFVSGVKGGEKILLMGSNALATDENIRGDKVDNPDFD